MSKVVISYLVWSDEPKKYLATALAGVAKQTYARENLCLLIIYNSHKPNEESCLEFIRQETAKMEDHLPKTVILSQEKNLGFSGGNNVAMRWAVENGFDYIFLHNADGFLHEQAVKKMVEAYGQDQNIGQLQPMILLHPENDLINSSGNALHYLLIGYTEDFRQKQNVVSTDKLKEVGYVSGGATLLRCDLLKKYGNWSDAFFMYHEDTEYSLRLRLLGYKLVMAPRAIFFHQYQFAKTTKTYFWIERNRHALQLIIYKWPTLLLLLPIEMAYNLGLLILAAKNGWLAEVGRVYAYWLRPSSWRLWLAERKRLQILRTIGDRQLLAHMTPRLDSARVGLAILAAPINAIFTFYFFLLKIVIKW